jgi:hypothetical protein
VGSPYFGFKQNVKNICSKQLMLSGKIINAVLFDEEIRLFIAACQAPTPKYPISKEIVWKIDIDKNMQVKAF